MVLWGTTYTQTSNSIKKLTDEITQAYSQIQYFEGYELVDSKALELDQKMFTFRELNEITLIQNFLNNSGKTLGLDISLKAMEGLVRAKKFDAKTISINSLIEDLKVKWNTFEANLFDTKMKENLNFSVNSLLKFGTLKETAITILTQLRPPVDPSDKVVVEILKQFNKNPGVEYDLEAAIITAEEVAMIEKPDFKIDWVSFGFQGDSLSSEILDVLETLEDNEISKPIPIGDGSFRLVKVKQRIPMLSLEDADREMIFKEVKKRWLASIQPFLKEIEEDVAETLYLN